MVCWFLSHIHVIVVISSGGEAEAAGPGGSGPRGRLRGTAQGTGLCSTSDYVRKYLDVKNRAF